MTGAMVDLTAVPGVLARITNSVSRVVYGAEHHTRLATIALLVRGHILLEGVPGTGKTLFARALSTALGMSMRRVQCTPDLMPGDILGTNLFDFRTQTFSLTRGPVFTEMLIADEINRMPPKTQSALLEAMQERAVTIDGTSHQLSTRFTVIATQNPIEQEGTYPLPEAQLDRFLFKIGVDYPPEAAELATVATHSATASMPDLHEFGVIAALDGPSLDALRMVPAAVRLDEKVTRYVVELARASRVHPSLSNGLSTRAATLLGSAARAHAALEGRPYAIPDDVKAVFAPLARHRVALSPAAELEGRRADEVLAEVVTSVEPPR